MDQVNPESHQPSGGRLAWWQGILAVVAVVIFVTAVLGRMTVTTGSLYWGDISLYFYPLLQVMREGILSGRLPLWNRYVLCGQPLVGNPQAWLLYPTTAFLRFLPVWFYLTVNSWLHLVLAGIFTYVFLRRVCGDHTASALGAITFAGSGYMVARLQFPPMAQSAAYLPLILLLTDRLMERPDPVRAAWLAVGAGLLVLAGHPQVAYLCFAVGAAYAFSRVWLAHRGGTYVRKTLRMIVLAGTIFALIAAVQVLPVLQLFRVSTRAGMTVQQANRFRLEPEQVLNFIFPHYYGDPAKGDFWGRGNAWETCVYVGLIPLLLSGYAVWRGWRRPAVAFFGILGGVSLWLALGRNGGLFSVAFYIVPGISSFHDPARFLYVTTFALAVLTAIGLRLLRERSWSAHARVAVFTVAAANLWWFSYAFNPVLPRRSFRYRPAVLSLAPERGVGRVLSTDRDAVWRRYLSYTDYGPDSVRYAHELSNTLSPNIGMRYHVEEAVGYEPVPIKAVTEIDSLTRIALARRSERLASIVGLFNVEMVLMPEGDRYPSTALLPESAHGVAAYRVRVPMPRVWLVRRTRRVEGDARELAVLSGPDFQPSEVAIVTGANGLPEQAPGVMYEPCAPVSIDETSDTVMAVRVNAGKSPAFLVWSSSWCPGWHATIDGRSVSIIRTNHAFCGVTVPAGQHAVVFRYAPSSFRLGLYLMLVGFACAAGAVCGGWTRGLSRPRRIRAGTRLI